MPVRVTVPQMMLTSRVAASAAKRIEMLLGAIQKAFLFEQIARRVAGERQFREDHHVRARLSGPPGKAQDALAIAAKVADGGVGLRQGDFHGVVLFY